MIKNNTKWSKEEIEFLINNYPIYGKNYCSEKLNRTPRSVFDKARKLNLYVQNLIKKTLSQKYNKEMIQEAVNKSLCYSDVIRNLGLIPQAGNFDNIKNRIKEFKIDTTHFLTPGELTKIRLSKQPNQFKAKPLSEILIVNNSRVDNRKLKKRLFNDGIKEKKCELCSIGEDWNGGKLSLRLDHINGINTDYRLENLRIICPNCDSTLETYCAKNRVFKNKQTKNKKIINKKFEKHIRKCIKCESDFEANSSKHKFCSRKCRRNNINHSKKIKKCIKCNIAFNPLKKSQKYCSHNCHKLTLRQIERPSLEQLKNEIKNIGYTGTGKKYGVSDNTIRKWIKQYKKQQASVGERTNPADS